MWFGYVKMWKLNAALYRSFRSNIYTKKIREIRFIVVINTNLLVDMITLENVEKCKPGRAFVTHTTNFKDP